jgi:hypothetical protein
VCFRRFLEKTTAVVARTKNRATVIMLGNSGITLTEPLEIVCSIKGAGSSEVGYAASSDSNSSPEWPEAVTLNVMVATFPLPLKEGEGVTDVAAIWYSPVSRDKVSSIISIGELGKFSWSTPSGCDSTPSREFMFSTCRTEAFQRSVTSIAYKFCTLLIVMLTAKVSPKRGVLLDGTALIVVLLAACTTTACIGESTSSIDINVNKMPCSFKGHGVFIDAHLLPVR